MRAMRIDWKAIKHKMIERDIPNRYQLALASGVHQNSLKQDGPFVSVTVDKIAHALGCDPRELIMLEEVEGE